MIKAPRAGASKTRLVPPLGPSEAAALSVCFLRDTTTNIAHVSSRGGAEGVAVYTPAGTEAAFDGLLPETFSLLAQRGESFGDRLFYAAEDLLAVGYESLCLVDSDSPTLPPALLRAAVSALAREGDRVVLGAADDGGYYLIGLKHAHRHLFTDIDWSTAHVLSQTIERAAEINLEVAILPVWYDVDDAATLGHLCEELFSSNGERDAQAGMVAHSAPHTRRYLSQLIETQGRQRIWPDSATLPATKNKYGGIFISPDFLPESTDTFDLMLSASISEWARHGIKVVWLQVPAERSALIQVAIAAGFQFHHCSSSELMLTKGLVQNSYLPSYSTHTLGVGAVVLSEGMDILTVLERRDLEARPGYYKLPGGMLERGEHLADGVVREVYEETGIRAEFRGLLSFRHHHRGQFGTSNIYAVCRLRPLTYDISIDEVEIGRAMWLPVEEYLRSEDVGLYNKRVVQAALSSVHLASVKIDGYMEHPDDYEIYLPQVVT